MKKQFIILSLVGVAFIGTSCGNSKTAVVGAGEKQESNEVKVVENTKEPAIIPLGSITAPARKSETLIEQTKIKE